MLSNNNSHHWEHSKRTCLYMPKHIMIINAKLTALALIRHCTFQWCTRLSADQRAFLYCLRHVVIGSDGTALAHFTGGVIVSQTTGYVSHSLRLQWLCKATGRNTEPCWAPQQDWRASFTLYSYKTLWNSLSQHKRKEVGKGDALITGDAVSVINLLCIHVQ